MAEDLSQNIQAFLETLKLADKYSDLFIHNGYMTVGDCDGMTEETLKSIGITLTGHYRRILSKLPNSANKKPPRHKIDPPSLEQPQSIPNDLIDLESQLPTFDDFLHKSIYDIPPAHSTSFQVESTASSRPPLFQIESTTLANQETPYLTNKPLNEKKVSPTKPPRSPRPTKKSMTSPEDQGNLNHDFGTTFETARNIREAVDVMLQKSPSPTKKPSPLINEHLEAFDEDPFEAYSSLTSEGFVNSLPLPSPPAWVSPSNIESNEAFPSLPPEDLGTSRHSSMVESESPYDSLNRNMGMHKPLESKASKELPVSETAEQVEDVYDCETPFSDKQPQNSEELIIPPSNLPKKNMQVAPARIPNYEEVSLFENGNYPKEDESLTYEEPMFNKPHAQSYSNNSKTTETTVDNSYSGAINLPSVITPKTLESKVEKVPLSKQSSVASQNSSMKRSTSFELYEAASESAGTNSNSSLDNLYQLCEVLQTSPPKLRQNGLAPKTSHTLPRSSGSLPSSTVKPHIANSPVTLLRERNRTTGMQSLDSTLSDLSSDADVYQTAEDIRQNETIEDEVYQTIDQPNEIVPAKIEPKPKKEFKPMKGWPGKSKQRLGQSRKATRPVSAFVDNLKHMVHSSSEESLESLGRDTRKLSAGHTRAASTSDPKFFTPNSGELIDAEIEHSNKNPAISEHMFSPQSPLMQKVNKKGWLYKHGGNEGRAPLRKRWVVFDGEDLIYYESDTKMDLSKGIIPVDVILRVQVDKTEPRVFHIVTKGGRKYIFNAETSDEKTLWTSTLLAAMMIKEDIMLAEVESSFTEQLNDVLKRRQTFPSMHHLDARPVRARSFHDKQTQGHFKPGGTMYMPYREGYLKQDGNRQKIYFATKGEMLAYYKTNHEFNFGQPMARLSMKIATVKELDKKRFQIIFPFRTFSLTADSEEEKRSWVDALNDAIAEGLSDYKVVREVWTTTANRKCADCGREDPDWASINLAIVICKHCAGVHRDLGVHNSKVRSLKMDVKIWNESMKNMLLFLGNDAANSFWRAKIKSSETINDMADKKQRAWHITSKYIEMRYLELHGFSGNQELLNLELIEAVRRNDLTEAYKLVFSGADPNCATGKEHAKTPHLLAKHLGYNVMAEFLAQNGATEDVSPKGHVTDRSNCVRKKDSLPKSDSKPPLSLKDQLFKYGGDFKSQVDDKKGRNINVKIRRPGEFQKRLVVLENNVFKYYDPDRVNSAKDEIECSELLSVGIIQPEQAVKAGYSYCFEVGRITGRTYLFCSDRKEILGKWTMGLMQAIVPPHVQNSMKNDMIFERIGKLHMKSQHYAKKPSEWRQTWCRLLGKHLSYFHLDSLTMEVIDLRRLVQISLDLTQEGTTTNSTGQSNKEPVPTFMLVFKDKSYYFRSDTKADSESWMSAIKKADSDSDPKIEEQQLTAEGVPIILEKCTTFIEQFGLTTRGIYRLSGTHSKTTQLLSDFQHNARDTQMHDADLNVHDVANALKRWFKSLPGSLLTEELHNQWIDTSDIKSEQHQIKLKCYKHLIEQLPPINRDTLKHLLIHLNNVASHAKENEMTIHNLAIVYGPTLLESQSEGSTEYIGQTSQEISCVEDLLRYYDWLFDVTDVDREKERLFLEAKEKITMASQQQGMLTTLDYDMMVPIYLISKDEKCVNYKVNMNAGELISKICKAHDFPRKTWGLFEVIADGFAERPLHHTEHVLSVIKAWEMPSTNYLLAKHDYVRDKVRWVDPKPKFAAIETLYEGEVRVFDQKKKWVKMVASLKRSEDALTLNLSKNQEGTSIRDVTSGNWRKRSLKVQSISRRIGGNFDMKAATTISLGHYNIYLGLDKAKTSKPPSSWNHGFILAHRGETTRYFVVDSEASLNKWYGNVLVHKFPQGFSPPPSPELSPVTEQLPTRIPLDSGNFKRYTMPPRVSQGDLGEAAKAVALQRMSSTGSDDMLRENVYEAADQVGGLQDSIFTPAAPPSARPTSLYPDANDARVQRIILSPNDPQIY